MPDDIKCEIKCNKFSGKNAGFIRDPQALDKWEGRMFDRISAALYGSDALIIAVERKGSFTRRDVRCMATARCLTLFCVM